MNSTAQPTIENTRVPTKKARPSTTQIFLTGAFACLGIYSVFYLKSHAVVHGFVGKYHTTGVLFAGVALLVVASMSGGWAIFSESKSFKTAFLAGLGFPGLLFGASLGFGSGDATLKQQSSTSQAEFKRASLLPTFAAISTGVPDAAVQGFRLVFNPVGVLVSKSERERVIANDAAREAIALANEQVPKVTAEKPVIVMVAGNVEVIDSTGTAQAARTGQLLEPGMRLRTLEFSRAMVKLPNNEQFLVRELSVLSIPKTPDSPRSPVELLKGAIYLFGREKSSEIRIQTPHATGAPQG